MHKPYLFSLFALLMGITAQAQHLVSFTLKKSWDIQQVDSFYTDQGLPAAILPLSNGVDVYKVVYNTLSYDSVTPTQASGLLVIPHDKPCASPILSYQHGTVLKRTDAPSDLNGEYVVGVAMGADGYIGLIPDYLGLGASTGIHPYVHASSEATAVADMIRAAREVCDSLDVAYNEQVFLTGYSQGGHATMAAHRYMQENFPNEFHVQASVPMSGPYSLSEVMRDLILSNVPYSNPAYLPMVINMLHNVYGVYPNLSTALLSPYDTQVPIWTSGTYSSSYVDGQMNSMGANPPKLIIKPAVLDTFTTDSTHVLRALLKKNDVYRWVPQVPVRFLYCMGDEQVSYLNAIKAYEFMTAAGAPNVSKLNVDSALDHFSCAQFAMLEMRNFFTPMRYDKIQLDIADYVSATGPAAPNGSITVGVTGGLAPFTASWSDGQTGLTATDLVPGNYTVTVTGADGCSATSDYIMNYTLGIASNPTAEARIFPNPATDVLYLQQLPGNYSITDMSGRTVKSGHAVGEPASVSVSDLPAGSYLLQSGTFRKLFIKK